MTQAEEKISSVVETLENNEKVAFSPDREREVSPDGTKATAQSILWAYKHLRSASMEAPQELARFLNSDTIESIEDVLFKDVVGLHLLQSRSLTPVLEKLRGHADEKVRACAKRLLVKQRSPAQQISLWPETRALPPLRTRGVQALGLSHNPFGPKRAEWDPFLSSYGIRPNSFWGWVRGPRPILAFGAPGSGKTATAFLLAYDCGFPPANPEEEGAFPIYHVLQFDGLTKAEGRSPFDQIARTLTEALLQMLAEKPHLFSDQDSQSKAAMAHLMLWYLGSGSFKNVELHLQRVGLEPRGGSVAVLEELESLVGDVSMNSPPDEVTLLDLLGKARPFGYTRTYLLVEPGIALRESGMEVISSVMLPILERANYLARNETYLKIFLPQQFINSLGENLLVDTIELSWTEEDLQKMLETRLVEIGIPSLAGIYSDPAGLCPDPDGRLIEAAELSPRRLVCLGNEMLARVEEPPLRPEHLPEGKVQ